MMIVFGTYSFTIREYTSEELNIKTENGKVLPILVKQKVFHLFYIPVFPIGKYYAMKLDDGKLYHLPDDLHQIVEERGPHKTPFYAFALPLLAMLGFLIYWGMEKKQQYTYHKYNQATHTAYADTITSELGHLSPENYIRLADVTERYSSEDQYLKVRAVNGSSVTCEVMGIPMYSSDATPQKLRSFFLRHRHLDTIVLTMAQLKEANITEYEDNNEDYKAPALLHDGKKYRIANILYIPAGPMLELYGEQYRTDSISPVMISNLGDPARLVEIHMAEGTPPMHWLDRLPLRLDTDSADTYTELHTSTTGDHLYEATLVLEDSLRHRYEYLLEWNLVNWELSRKRQ